MNFNILLILWYCEKVVESYIYIFYSCYLDNLPTRAPTLRKHTPITTRSIAHHKCYQSMVYYGVELRGGWTAGRFIDKGTVSSLHRCVEYCCDDPSCDLVMLLSQKCFIIHCYVPENCQTTPNGRAQIAYVARDGIGAIGKHFLQVSIWGRRGYSQRLIRRNILPSSVIPTSHFH